jgi:hypothetical protein
MLIERRILISSLAGIIKILENSRWRNCLNRGYFNAKNLPAADEAQFPPNLLLTVRRHFYNKIGFQPINLMEE